MKKLYGVTVPLVTPFDAEGNVDTKSLGNLTNFLVKKNIQCLYPAGTTGEMMYLTVEERKQVTETVIQKNVGRAVVYVQTGAWNLKDTLDLSRHAAECGADGIGVMTPVFYKLTEEELFQYYKAVSESMPEDFPIYLYGIPQCAVNDITPELACRIVKECPNVVGIKYSVNNMSRIQAFMRLKEGTFSVLCGPDELFAVTCFAGGDGTVSGNANVIPEHYEAIWEAVKAGNVSKAMEMQNKTIMLNNILSAGQNIACYKAALKHRGVIAEKSMRAPLAGLAPEIEAALLKKLEQMNFTQI